MFTTKKKSLHTSLGEQIIISAEQRNTRQHDKGDDTYVLAREGRS